MGNRSLEDAIPPRLKAIDGECCRRLSLQLEGVDAVISPKKAEKALKAAGIPYHGTGGKYWIPARQWQDAHRALNKTIV